MKKIKRFQTISALPNTMKLDEVIITNKKFDESIVDKSCFSPLSEQLKNIQPMTPAESEQHFHFADGKDTGMKAPLPPSADIAERSQFIRSEQEAVKNTVNKAVEKTKKDIANQAKSNQILSNLGIKE